MAKYQKISLKVKGILLDKVLYSRTIKVITYITLFIVGILMTVLNIVNFGIWDILTWTTGIFSVLIIPNLLFTIFTEKGHKFFDVLFAIELLAMFTMFLYFGKPEGFSAIWIALLPIASMIFYGRLFGSVLSGIQFLILVLFFWTPLGKTIGMYNGYTDTFKIRFPILYVAFFLVAFFLETLQLLQFDELTKVNELNKNYSTHDQLTLLYNRKGFYDDMDNRCRTNSYDKIGVMIFDLDDFKNINDSFGHVAGDFVLQYFAQTVSSILTNGISCRWGGEEFLVAYFNDGISKKDIEKVRTTMEEHLFNFNGKKVNVTVSCGVFETNDKDNSHKLNWINNADAALYKAKQTGKNKIVYY